MLKKSKSEKDNVEKFSEKISSYIFIFDCEENTILCVNPSFEALTGYQTHLFDINFLIEMIHPDNLPYFFVYEDKNLKFTNNLLFGEHFRYILSYSYRIRIATGEYIRIKQECQALEVNLSGHLIKTLVIHKSVDYREKPADNDRKIFDKARGLFIDTNNTYNLSKRELEILQLIKDGYNSQEVAEKLNVSKNTVLTHRKNI